MYIYAHCSFQILNFTECESSLKEQETDGTWPQEKVISCNKEYIYLLIEFIFMSEDENLVT